MRGPCFVGACILASYVGKLAIAEGPEEQSKEIAPATTTEEKTLIPLKEIWAYDMPSTKNAKKLGASKTPEGHSTNPTIHSLNRLFAKRLRKREKAGPAFVVEGFEEVALKNMAAAIDREPEKYVPAGKDVSLVFYTHFSSYAVRIDAVERVGNKFVVPFQFVHRHEGNMTFHFALIPLGKLPPGEYHVEIEQLPTIDKFGGRIKHRTDLRWVVCQSSTFHVGE